MADVATPPMGDKKVVFQKPEKPDEDAFKAAEKKAEKEHSDAQAKYEAARNKANGAQPSKDNDTPQGIRRKELINELKGIREKQSAGKTGRGKTMDEIKKLDEKVKSLINEQKTALSKTPFKNAAEIDAKIKQLQAQVESGSMRIVDEKKALAEVSSLNKQKKGFTGFDSTEKQIDDTKKQLATLRKELDSPESKALSERYNKLQEELDVIKGKQDEAYKSISSLRDEATKARDLQQTKYHTLKKLRDDHFSAKRAFSQYEYEARQKFREKKKAENEAFDRQKKVERAERYLEEQSDKAFLDEIRRAKSLKQWADPTYKDEKAPLKAESALAVKEGGRTVDASAFKGMKAVSHKKDDEEAYFAGSGGKKGKKGRKAPAAESSFKLPPSVLEDCAYLKINPPTSRDDIPRIVEEVNVKLEHWQSTQDKQTEENIVKAKLEIDRLEAEEAEHAHTSTNGRAHGETKATASVDEGGKVENEIALEDAAIADAAADLKEAKIEDAAAPFP